MPFSPEYENQIRFLNGQPQLPTQLPEGIPPPNPRPPRVYNRPSTIPGRGPHHPRPPSPPGSPRRPRGPRVDEPDFIKISDERRKSKQEEESNRILESLGLPPMYDTKYEKENKEIAEQGGQQGQDKLTKEIAEVHKRRNSGSGNISYYKPPQAYDPNRPEAPPMWATAPPPQNVQLPPAVPPGPPPAYPQERYMEDLMRAARDEYQRPYQEYQGERIAPENQYERWADVLSQRLNTLDPFTKASQEQAALAQQGFPGQAQNYMNPYQQQVSDRIATEGNRNLKENILPALEAKFVRLGQHGGSRHAELSKNAAREAQGEISARQAQAMHAGYGQAADIFGNDQARRMQGAEHQMNLGKLLNASRLADISSLRQTGSGNRELAERRFRSQEEQHLNRLRHNAERFNLFKSILSGLPTQSPIQPTVPGPARSLHHGDYMNLAGLLGSTWLGNRGR